MSRVSQPVWREVHWPRPFDPESAFEVLERLASDRNMGPIIWEARARAGQIRYLLAADSTHIHPLVSTLKALLPGVLVNTTRSATRVRLQYAGHLRVTHPSLALSVERLTATTRSVLASLTGARVDGEEVVLQVLLGGRLTPHLLPANLEDPSASWLDTIRGTVRRASAEARPSMKSRISLHGFKCVIRIGAIAPDPGRARSLIASVLSGLRVAESAGVRLHLAPEHPSAINEVRRPWQWPLRLSSHELTALMGWPLGDGVLPGLPSEHPRSLAAPEGLRSVRYPFAETTAPGVTVKLGITAKDSLQHTVLLGPTGAGKSNAMLTLIMEAIEAGRGVLVIDPKRDLTNDVLARIPEHRKNDVVVIDPSDPEPVGLNPFVGSHKNPELVADSILAVFKELFADSWGPRTQDVLTSALITLARYPGATLTMLPALLTDQKFRTKLTRGITDKIGLAPFWASYDAMSPEQRAQVIAPVMNKLRQFLLRPALRAVLGQSEPRFQMNDLFTQKRIVLISLNKGLLGAEGARLLGSLVVSQLWPLTLARAALPAHRRHIVNVFIDEVQDYLALPTDLDDALSQARGLGVGFTLAHQYRMQLPSGLRAGVDANVHNRIVFGLNATDAAEMAKQAPKLDVQDFMLLPRFGIYTHLMRDGHATGWMSARTLAASPATTDPIELKHASTKRYGRSAEDVEKEVLHSIGLAPTSNDRTDDEDEPIGRRHVPKGRP